MRILGEASFSASVLAGAFHTRRRGPYRYDMVRELRRLGTKYRPGSIGVHRREKRSGEEREGPTRKEKEKAAVRLGEDCSKSVRDQPSRGKVAVAATDREGDRVAADVACVRGRHPA